MRHVLDGYWDRLLGVTREGYRAHRTTSDFVWNSVGQAAWALLFPMLTVVVTQLVGIEEAGLFSLAFVTANVLLFVANYGVRAFQASDVHEDYSFADYQFQRWVTCAAMRGAGALYCLVRGYAGEMFAVSIGVYAFRMMDGAADVYEGRLQQKDKLYLAGISQAIRSVAPFLGFTIALSLTQSLVTATIVMDALAAVALIVFTIPMAAMETPRSERLDLARVRGLFVQCFPLFLALFLYNFIDSMPKFVMEGVLGYDSELLFNAICFPAQAILVVAGLIYKPLLVRMTDTWQDVSRRRSFDMTVISIFVLVALVTVIFVVVMNLIGIPIMNFMYGLDFSPLQRQMDLLLVAGGVTGGIDFLYQVITIIRRQSVIRRVYVIGFVVSVAASLAFEHALGFDGAVYAYLLDASALCAMLLREYVHARRTTGAPTKRQNP
ncbi:MAG: lipopolysaccharide biosynthesis protein [Coriobacteriales bacterium]